MKSFGSKLAWQVLDTKKIKLKQELVQHKYSFIIDDVHITLNI